MRRFLRSRARGAGLAESLLEAAPRRLVLGAVLQQPDSFLSGGLHRSDAERRFGILEAGQQRGEFVRDRFGPHRFDRRRGRLLDLRGRRDPGARGSRKPRGVGAGAGRRGLAVGPEPPGEFRVVGTGGGQRLGLGEQPLLFAEGVRVGVLETVQQLEEPLLPLPDSLRVVRRQPRFGAAAGEPAHALRGAAAGHPQQRIGVFDPANGGVGDFPDLGPERHLHQTRSAGDRLERPAAGVGGAGPRGDGGERLLPVPGGLRILRGLEEAAQRFLADGFEARPTGDFGQRTKRGDEAESAARLFEVPVVGGDPDEQRFAPRPGKPARGLVAGLLGERQEHPRRLDSPHRFLPYPRVGIPAGDLGQRLGVVGRMLLHRPQAHRGVAASERRGDPGENRHRVGGARI